MPVGELAGIALLLFFGVRALKDGLTPEEGPAAAEEEMADAEDAVKQVRLLEGMKAGMKVGSTMAGGASQHVLPQGELKLMCTLLPALAMA